jgi:hypothetical protein
MSGVSGQKGPQLLTLGWALRRAALGLVMLFSMVMLGAWLFYASIDPNDGVAVEVAPSSGGPAQPQTGG